MYHAFVSLFDDFFYVNLMVTAGTVLILFALSIAVPLIFYGIQHYLSIAGSLVFVPLILVPTMGGSDVRPFLPFLIPLICV